MKKGFQDLIAEHEQAIRDLETKLAAFKKERETLQANRSLTRAQARRVSDLGQTIEQAQIEIDTRRTALPPLRQNMEPVDRTIQTITASRRTVQRDLDASEKALKSAQDTLDAENRRAERYLGLYDVALRARLFDATMKEKTPPFDEAKYEEATATRRSQQLEQERQAVEAGRYATDATLRKLLSEDGAKFFQRAKLAAGQKPIDQPPTQATAARRRTIQDIENTRQQYVVLLQKGLPDPKDLKPLVERAHAAVWEMR